MSVVATKEMDVGEEILVNYNYDVAFAPEWYQQLWQQFVSEGNSC